MVLSSLQVCRCSKLCSWPMPMGHGDTLGAWEMVPEGKGLTAGLRWEQVSFELLHSLILILSVDS